MTEYATTSVKRATYFALGVMGLSVLAGLFIEDNRSPAALLFVMSPALVTLALRACGDGWSDSGLRPSGSVWHYTFAIVFFPLLGAFTLAIGWVSGSVHLADDFWTRFGSAFATQLVPCLVFAFGEEWGWRGYLEPRLASAGFQPFVRHLMVGVLWAVWHVPYILALGSQYTSLPLIVQLPLFHVAVVVMAFIWGPLRTRSKSALPAILGHGIASAVALPLLDPATVTILDPLWFAARPEGLVTLLGLTLAAVVVYRTTTASNLYSPRRCGW